MARTRKRFWAKTLTLTAALLAVVWVVSMKVRVGIDLTEHSLRLSAGSFFFIRVIPAQFAPDVFMSAHEGWRAEWWFGHIDTPTLNAGGRLVLWHAPLWPFVLLTGVPGVWMLVKTRKHTNPNACPACGYDRTGLPQTSAGPAPCPECGKNA